MSVRMLLAATTAAVTIMSTVQAFAQEGAEGVTADKILLGTTTPLSGPVAPTCKPLNEGAQAWFNKVNAEGGVHGRKIENVVLDDAYKAPEALANTRELVSQNVFAIFGGCGTLQPPAIMPLAQQNKIPYLFPFAANPDLMKAPYTFVVFPTYENQYNSLFSTLIKQDGGGKIFAVLSDVPGVDVAIAGLTKAAKDNGGEFVGSEVVKPHETDFTPIALKIKSSDADYVAINLNGAASARLVLAIQANSAYPKKYIIGGPTNATASFIEPAGAAADGKVLATLPIAAATDENAKSCVEAIQAHDSSLKLDFSSLWGCATAQLMVAALEEAGPNPTRAGLVENLEKWTDKKASPMFPPLTFSQTKRLGLSSMYYVEVAGGSTAVKGEFNLQPTE